MYSPSSPSRRRRWILRESETQHEYCTNSFDSLDLKCCRPGGGMADAEDLKSSGDFSSCGFDSHPGHHFPFSKIPGPSARSFSAKEGDSCAEQHEFKHAPSAFSLGHFVGSNWSYRLSVFRRSTQFPEPECSSGRRPHLSRFRSQYLSRRSGSPHSAKNVFLRRLLAQPSAGREAKQLGRQTWSASRARLRFSRSLSRTAEPSAEIPGAVRRDG